MKKKHSKPNQLYWNTASMFPFRVCAYNISADEEISFEIEVVILRQPRMFTERKLCRLSSSKKENNILPQNAFAPISTIREASSSKIVASHHFETIVQGGLPKLPFSIKESRLKNFKNIFYQILIYCT